MPICIAGMGRSGTSMVTKLLHRCGLYLGDERDLMPGDGSNADGYWESTRFVALNDAILNELGGAWDCPPVETGWKNSEARLKPLYATANNLLHELAASEPSGWKDPRNSLTLPFWQSLLPNLKVVVCLRNPLEVAVSLARRQQFSYALSMNLWAIYNRRVLAVVPPEGRIITHYDRYFSDPAGEINRVLQFIGMSASGAAVAQCRESVAGTLRHQQFTTQHLRDANVASDVMTLYEGLCTEAGWVRERPTEPVPTLFTSTHESTWLSSSEAPSTRDRDGDGTGETAMQPGVASAAIGRLDRSAVTAAILRQQLDRLTAQLADRNAIIGEFEIALEQCRQAAAHQATLVNELAAARTEQRQSVDRIRMLAEALAEAETRQQALRGEVRELQRQRDVMEAERQQQTAWAEELESRLHEIEGSAWYRVWSRWHAPS